MSPRTPRQITVAITLTALLLAVWFALLYGAVRILQGIFA